MKEEPKNKCYKCQPREIESSGTLFVCGKHLAESTPPEELKGNKFTWSPEKAKELQKISDSLYPREAKLFGNLHEADIRNVLARANKTISPETPNEDLIDTLKGGKE